MSLTHQNHSGPHSIPVEGVFNLVEQVTPNGQKVLCFQPLESNPATSNALTKRQQFKHPIYLTGPPDANGLTGAIDGRTYRFEGEIVPLGPAIPNPSQRRAQSVSAGKKPARPRKQIEMKTPPPADLSHYNEANAIASTSTAPPPQPPRTRRKPKPRAAIPVCVPNPESMIGWKGKAAVRGQGKCTCKV